MDALLLSLSKLLMLTAFWVGIPALLLSMLLLLGFRLKNRLSLSIFLVGFCGLACFILGISLEGIVTGKALTLSKWGPTTVNLADDPQSYWLSTSVWIAGSIVFLGIGVWLLIRQLKNPNPAYMDSPNNSKSLIDWGPEGRAPAVVYPASIVGS